MLMTNAVRWLALMSVSSALVACGGEREEPFNPSEPDEVREGLTVAFVHESQTSDEYFELPATAPDLSSRRLEVIRDSEDFERLIGAYTFSDVVVNTPDFEQGQVVLYDSGWFDDSACAQQLTLHRVEAVAITEDESIGEVVLQYNRSSADEEASCESELPLRQWEFHYIETRADLIVVEQVRGLNEGGGSSTSGASSSSTSSAANNAPGAGF